MLVVNRHVPNGRLGNQLELATHLILFAIHSGQRVNIPFDDKLKKYFPFFSGNLLNCFPRVPCRWRPSDRIARQLLNILIRKGIVREIDLLTSQEWIFFDSNYNACRHGEALRRIKTSRFCAASLWRFRAASIADSDAEVVRAVLRPLPQILDFARRICKSIDADIIVGLHIRLGDFRAVNPDRIFSFRYYHNKLREISDCFPGRRVGFVICSDEEVEQGFDDFVCAFPKGNPVEDIFALAQCDYIVGNVSTFSRWAAFWGNKKLCRLTSETQKISSLDDFEVASFVPLGVCP